MGAGVTVRLAYNADNARRQAQARMIIDSAARAGITVVDAGKPAGEWGELLTSEQDKYDASLFGWQATSLAVTEADATFRCKPLTGVNNHGGYCNPAVDTALASLQVALDPAAQVQLQLEIDTALWADAAGITLFQYPAIWAWDAKLSGVQPTPIGPGIVAGFWNWHVAG